MRRTRGLSTRLVVAIGVLAALHVAVFVVLLVTLHGLSEADERARRASRVVVAANDARLALAREDAVSLHAAGAALVLAGHDAGAPALAAIGARTAAQAASLDAGAARAKALDERLAAMIATQRVVRNTDRDEVRELTRIAWIAGVSGIGATFVCAICFLAYVRRSMLVPLRAVATAAQRLASGDLHARVGPSRGVGEVGELARTFDQMADSLEESRAALERQNRELAEQRTELIEAVRSAREGVSIVRAMLDTTPDAIALLDGGGATIVDNPPMRAVRAAFATDASGLGPDEPAAGAREGGSEQRDEVVLPGTHRTFARFAAPVRDGRGRSIGRLLVLREVTGEREAERAKEDFFALVSHELRTPLTAILGFVELVLTDDAHALPPEHARHLEVVERNARRLVRLVGDLLFAAQIEGAPLLLEPGAVDVEQLVRDAVELARARADEAGVALTLELTPLEPFTGDRDRLSQVLDNLISNALKFTPPGGGVSVRLTADSDGCARIEVADTGVGIPAADLPRLFDRFYRAGNVTERAVPGLGLGLMIVRAIAEAHGGAVKVRSEVGHGTTFTVLLPLRARADGARLRLHNGAPGGAPEGSDASGELASPADGGR